MGGMIVAEVSKTGEEHSTFNQGVLRGVRDNKLEVTLISSLSHKESLNYTGDHKRIPVISIRSRRFVGKFLVELYALLYTFHVAKKRREPVLILSLFTPLLPVYAILSSLLRANTLLVLHAEVDALSAEKPSLFSYTGWFNLFIQSKVSRYGRYILLRSDLSRNINFSERRNFIFLDHPMRKWECPTKVERQLGIACAGWASKEKHGNIFAKAGIHYALFGKNLRHVGGADRLVFENYRRDVDFTCGPSLSLSVKDYERELSKTKAVFFPYHGKMYQHSVSGAIVDAISFGCRVYCQKNSYADHLVRSGFGIKIVCSFEDAVRLEAEHSKCGNENSEYLPMEFTYRYFVRKVSECLVGSA